MAHFKPSKQGSYAVSIVCTPYMRADEHVLYWSVDEDTEMHELRGSCKRACTCRRAKATHLWIYAPDLCREARKQRMEMGQGVGVGMGEQRVRRASKVQGERAGGASWTNLERLQTATMAETRAHTRLKWEERSQCECDEIGRASCRERVCLYV